MKNLYLCIWLLHGWNCFAQDENVVGIDYSMEKYDTISCVHFLQAHHIVAKAGTPAYSSVVDYPILKYINETNHCDNLMEHNINVNELRYFIFVILSNEENTKVN